MQLDIRIPIGLLFTLLGLILALYGLTSSPAIYQRSLGININLAWGLVLLLFGLAMLLLAYARRDRRGPPPVDSTGGKCSTPR